MAELLLEIETEEIPARMMTRAHEDLRAALDTRLGEAGLAFSELIACSTPRQLTLYCRDLAARQKDREEVLSGPPVRIAYDAQGKPTKALEGFLAKNPAIQAGDLFRLDQKKGEVVAARVQIAGRHTRDILAEAIPAILAKLNFAKTMRWSDEPTRFVRPVHGILALFDGEVIPFHFAGIQSGSFTFGHRLFGNQPLAVKGIADYLQTKEAHGIILDHEDRLSRIVHQIEAHLATVGGRLVQDEPLLQAIADLVELPYVVLGHFDPAFLAIPREVLIISIREHQKSFAVQDEAHSLMPYFLAIASVAGDHKGLIRKGNEWVLNARLWDAKFFWDSDRKKDFANLREKLKNLVFQSEIGSYFEKTERLKHIAEAMAGELGWDLAARRDLREAAENAKADLVSELVFEFAELQGVAGGLLLRAQGRPEKVWQAVYDHYLPISMEDELPRATPGALISIADKLDTLTGCFAIGLIPTGSKDPYALRRSAQGIVRILIEQELPLSLSALVDAALAAYGSFITDPGPLKGQLLAFFDDRVRYCLKRAGFDHDLVEAVMARQSDRLDQTVKRARAIAQQQGTDHFRSLALNLKRMNNVVADEQDRLPTFDANLLGEATEIDLWRHFVEIKPAIEEAVEAKGYNRAMDLMTSLAAPVDTYFGTSGVFVNVDDDRIRLNRKSMLNQIRLTLGLVADISCLASRS